jgi:hypothetical protein
MGLLVGLYWIPRSQARFEPNYKEMYAISTRDELVL